MMRIFLLSIIIIFTVFPVLGQDIDPEDVRTAIEQGIQFLKRNQKTDGHWDEWNDTERCGSTSLAILALVSCGVPKNDAVIQRGMQYLRNFPGKESGRNYALSLQTMAFCLVDPDQDRALIRNNVMLLERNQIKNGQQHDGGWTYHPWDSGNGSSDLSNSQFSILALYEAERVGVSVSRDTWRRALRYWEASQNSNNGWGYNPEHTSGSGGSRGSMSCAGIASLVITSGMLDSSAAAVRGDRIICFQPPEHHSAEKIKKGLSWLASNFSISQNPGMGDTYLYYYLYALERVGRMTNQRFIGKHDWYREGTDKLLYLRDRIDGAWRGKGTGDIPSTSLALLFLSKGRRPVLMSKIQYSDTNSWNLHPNDANNLTAFAEPRWHIDLTWQIIDLQPATADHLLQSPVLYFSGNKTPLQKNDAETAKMAAKLREYLDQGGFIMAEAQPNGQSFDKGFRELMKLVFPEPDYELTLLEQSHPIWSAEIPIEPEQLRPIEGISFGCRTSVVYIPPFKDPKTGEPKPSLSCLWEVAKIFQRGELYPDAVQKQIDAGLGIGLNILAYATNRELKYKDQIAESITKKAAALGLRRGRIFVTFLDSGGAMNPAPHAPLNLLFWLETNLGLPVVRRVESINPASEDLYENPILFMHGRTAVQFSIEQRNNLKKHLECGGFLFANAVCSSKPFADSFRAEIEKMFPDLAFQAIPLDDPLFSDDYGGFAVKTLDVRLPEQSPGRKIVAPLRQEEPKLYGIKLENGNRWAVVFSPYDVSCALEKASSLECRGYTQESAMKLAANVILYALEHW